MAARAPDHLREALRRERIIVATASTISSPDRYLQLLRVREGVPLDSAKVGDFQKIDRSDLAPELADALEEHGDDLLRDMSGA